MKKMMFILLLLGVVSTALAQISVFPMTNVMEVTVGSGQSTANLQQGQERLKTQYDDDYLIILEYYPASSPLGNTDTEAMFTTLGASSELSVFFNGAPRTYQDNPLLRFGQPIWGNMSFGQYAPSPLYIDNLTLSYHMGGSLINFTLKDAADGEAFSNLTVYFIIVETVNTPSMETNYPVRFVATHTISTTDGQDQDLHLAINDNYIGNNYKAVVLIRKPNMEIIQAASTQRVTKPFRIVSTGQQSRITDNYFGDEGEYGPTYQAYFKYIYLVNTDFSSNTPINITFSLTPDNLPAGMTTSFCTDPSDGNCYFGEDDTGIIQESFTLDTGTSFVNYASIFPYYATGFTKIKIRFTGSGHTAEFPIYYCTDDVDVLIIQDDAGEDTESIILDAMSRTGLTYGIFKPDWADFMLENTDNIQYIIWNAPTLYPSIKSENLNQLATKIENGTKLIASGQWLANAMNSNALSAYYTPQSLVFLMLMSAQFTPGSTINYTITGNPNAQISIDFDITLLNNNSSLAQYSPNSISDIVYGSPFLYANGTTKGISNDVGEGKTAILDFDLNSMTNPYHRTHLLSRILNYFGLTHTAEDDDIIPAPQRATLSIYPNPVKSSLTIDYKPTVVFPISEGGRGVASVQTSTPPNYTIYNIRGQKITSGKLTPAKDGYSAKIDTERLAVSSGIYFIKVSENQNYSTKKVLIIK